MADQLLGIVTDTANAWAARSRVYGYGWKVTRFVIGSEGHDPSNPRLARTPDSNRDGCYCSQESITTAGGCLFSDFVDSVTWVNDFCPVWNCVLEAGESVGVVSSICLIAEVVYSPIPADPVVGTEFLYSITNMPYQVKINGERKEYNIYVPTKL